ncbi:uncharacterized protein with ParB-like and HNH nuclease domain [Sphingomonas sp. PP-CE-3G-477]|jgi:hypothetical protein|uniref:DUF262 domain-containing protein n=1 Tax=Sphingomonas sp. PP-CE-3G-477 TaxID=2135660 RepID=UPI000D3843A4|nr:DUF262 domain-containing protein [Sphingomonas sp. PP-CE-3G-477]PTQ59147.1 uncharacterized protein with ParB-like and HNH nuclease domain [Sphingomonas sp. PP-CE-3G-477]
MYLSGGTIADALSAIQKRDYVLPAIQREFVWKPEQIERLFDSLMQGYPFGTFLFWKVEPDTAGKFRFYDFVLDYHQRDAAHCPPVGKLPGHPIVAVLDGQQRLTALNIGLRGSMAVRQPGKWWTNDAAFPKRKLCLDLTAPREADEDGAIYRFKFLSKAQVDESKNATWLPISKVLALKDVSDLHDMIEDYDLEKDQRKLAFNAADRLRKVVHDVPSINVYEEKSQDIERVLNIFIRLNAGGTVLSYSDLLLSIAVAQWKQLDAREAIHGLVDNLNDIGRGFTFSHDFVLKAGLMLADISSVGFKVENFTAANMAKLEAKWESIDAALRLTVGLVANFGLSGQTLRADSALLPIAYYIHQRGFDEKFLSHSSFGGEREAIRGWLLRSLLKASGIWGSGLDALLTALREKIKGKGQEEFPIKALGRTMEARGKSLQFGEAEIDDLLHLPYGDRRMLPLLSLLFPFVDLRHEMHVDHVFPISRFAAKKLKKAGYDADEAEQMYEHANALPNLQLLEGAANKEKQSELPAAWLAKAKSNAAARAQHIQAHSLGEIPEDLPGFALFIEKRRAALRARLYTLLGTVN